MTYYSQLGQDKYLNENIFKGFKNGYFVDVGANDGLSINNTLFFERNLGWTGINIEPLEVAFEKLKVNRPNCINLRYAICNENGTANFLCNEGYTEMLSGLEKSYDPRHHERREAENKIHNAKTKVIQVQTIRLEDLFEEYNVKHIHFISIDVEGGEFEVIKSINFDKVFIDVIVFENNYSDASLPIVQYLKNKGFIIKTLDCDIIMIHNKSEFYEDV
jgi:FkbM family methyltransferase